MKKTVLLILSLLFVQFHIFSQTWFSQYPGFSYPYGVQEDICFVNKTTGYLAGLGGLYKTTDAGLYWSIVYVDPNVTNFRSVAFRDANFGIVVGSSGNIFKTENGGMTWTKITVNSVPAIHFTGVHFVKAANGASKIVIIGGPSQINNTISNNQTIITSVNDGLTWKVVRDTDAVVNSYYRSVVSGHNILILTNWGVDVYNYKTDVISSGSISTNFNRLKGIYALNSKEVWAVGEAGMVFKSNTGGLSWSRQTGFNFNNTLTDVFFVSPLKGYISGNSGKIYHTSDGGATWSQQLSASSDPYNLLYFHDQTNGLTVGVMDLYTTFYSSYGLNGLPIDTVSQAVNMDNSLALHYSFNSNFNDVKGENHAENHGARYSIGMKGEENSAAYFDGIDDYGVGTDAPILSGTDFTISFWVKTDFTSDFVQKYTVLDKYNETTKKGIELYLNYSGILHINVNNYSSGFSIGEVNDNKYHHILVTGSNTEGVQMYIDGVNKANFAPVGNIANSETLMIGRGKEDGVLKNHFFKGKLDELKIFNAYLYSSDVSGFYNSEKTGLVEDALEPEDLVAYYKFSGNTADSSWYNRPLTNTSAVLSKGVTGKDEEAYSFSGSAMSGITSTYDITKYITVGGWVRTEQFQGMQGIVSHYDNTNRFGYQISIMNGFATVDGSNRSNTYNFSGGGFISDGLWHHVMLASNGELWILYLDGVEVGRQNYTNTNPSIGPNIAPLIGSGLKGSLDEIKMYNVMLSSNEIMAIYNERSGDVFNERNNLGDLVMHYKFSGNAEDSSPYARHLTLNGPIQTEGIQQEENEAYYFDGVNDFMSRSTFWDGITYDMSASLWVKTTSTLTLTQPLINKVYNNQGYYVAVKSGMIEFTCMMKGYVNRTLLSTKLINDGVWHHVVVTKDDAVFKIYIDGELNATVAPSLTNTFMGVDASLIIGFTHFSNASTKYFEGYMDEIRIYKKALTIEEVLALYLGNDVTTGNSERHDLTTKAYPVPFKSELNISFSFDRKPELVEIYNVYGKLMERIYLNSEQVNINTSAWPNGIYLLQGVDNGLITESIKVSK
jgi:photosystem II stability/assembly factor-like uncharacterized protein